MNKLSIIAALSVGVLALGGVYAENQTGAVAPSTTGAVAPMTGLVQTGVVNTMTGSVTTGNVMTGNVMTGSVTTGNVATGDVATGINKDLDDGVAIGGHKMFMSGIVGALRPVYHVGKNLPVSFHIMQKQASSISGMAATYGSFDGGFSGNFKVSVEMSSNLIEPRTWKALDPKDYSLTGIDATYSGTSYQLSGLRFQEPGFYRIHIQQEGGEMLSGTEEINVFTYQSEYAFTGDELTKVKAVSQIWDNLIDTLKNQSPSLSGNQNWIKASNTLKYQMDTILNYENSEKEAKAKNIPNYYFAPTDWKSFTYVIEAWMNDTLQLRK